MRWVFCLLMLFGMASSALAADYDLPILRGSSQPPAPVVTVGPATFTRWSGLYFGGVVSYNNATTDFINATAPLVHFSLRSTTLEQQATPSGIAVLGRGSDNALGGGAFLGYNTQWQDLIIGVEATYNHTNLNTTAPVSAVARIFPSLNNDSCTQRHWEPEFNRLRRSTVPSRICCRQSFAVRFRGRRGGIRKLQRKDCGRRHAKHQHDFNSRLFVRWNGSCWINSDMLRIPPSSTAPGKTMLCSGGSPSAPDLIGR